MSEPYNRHGNLRLTKEVIAKAAKLHADLGLSWTMLGERFGVSATAMRKALVKCGKKPPEL